LGERTAAKIPAARQDGQGYYDENNGKFGASVSPFLIIIGAAKRGALRVERACYNYLAVVEVTK
jgi:hypothetical protein